MTEQPRPDGPTRDRVERIARAAGIDLTSAEASRSTRGPDAVLDLVLARIGQVSSTITSEPQSSWDPIDDLTARLLVADLAVATQLLRAIAIDVRRALETAKTELAAGSEELKAVLKDPPGDRSPDGNVR